MDGWMNKWMESHFVLFIILVRLRFTVLHKWWFLVYQQNRSSPWRNILRAETREDYLVMVITYIARQAQIWRPHASTIMRFRKSAVLSVSKTDKMFLLFEIKNGFRRISVFDHFSVNDQQKRIKSKPFQTKSHWYGSMVCSSGPETDER